MNISIDSRTIQPGQIFIPVKGKNFDGRDFIDDVLKKGGRVLDVDLQDYAAKYRKKLTCSVIGITGSAGKTTLKDMLASVLSQGFNVVKTEENQNNEVGVPLTLLKADYQTDIIVVEMGIRHAGDMAVLSKMVRPTHAVVTNVGTAHLENFGTQGGIVREKGKIFQKPLKHETYPRHAYVNMSSHGYKKLKQRAETCGYLVTPIQGGSGIEQTMNTCYAIGRSFGLTDAQIFKGLEDVKPSAHRQTVIKMPQFVVIDDTYNSNPDALRYALHSLRQYPGRKIAVLGDMLELGKIAVSEHKKIKPLLIDAHVSMVFSYGPLMANYHSDACPNFNFESKEDLLKQLLPEIKPGDHILVKGSRGMAMETIVDALKAFHD